MTPRSSRRPVRFLPRLEALETRLVPTVTVVQNGSLLKITGNFKADNVQITDDGTGNVGAVRVTFNGKKANDTFLSAAPVNEIRVNLNAGKDFCTYTLTGPAGTPVLVSRKVDVKLGDGKDRFVGTMNAQAFGAGTFWDVAVHGQGDKDTIDLTVQGGVQTGANFNALVEGNANEDKITVNYTGEADGNIRFKADGGLDKDDITLIVNLLAGSETTASTADALGGAGKDILSLVARKVGADPANLIATINGGVGLDTCATGISNINVNQISC